LSDFRLIWILIYLIKKKENYVFERTKKILENYGALKQAEKKRFNLIYVLSYSGKRQDAQIGKTNRDIFDVWYSSGRLIGKSWKTALVWILKNFFRNVLIYWRK